MDWIRKRWVLLLSVAFSAAVFVPIWFYRYYVGTIITSKEESWAAMGSAMSGIYGPLLAALTFIVLIMQVQLQKQTNDHASHQAYLQNAREDTAFYLTRLADLLDKPAVDEFTVREILRRVFERCTVEMLSEEEVKKLGQSLDAQVPELLAIWMAIYPIYAGLSANPYYYLPFVSAKQKTIALLSYPTCAALDNFLFCRVAGRVDYSYQFSTVLSGQRDA